MGSGPICQDLVCGSSNMLTSMMSSTLSMSLRFSLPSRRGREQCCPRQTLHALAGIHHPLAGLHQRFMTFNCGIFERFAARPLGIGPIGSSNPRMEARPQASTLVVNLA